MRASLAQLAARLQPAEWVRVVGGPILESELSVASRRARTYIVRFVCAAALFAIAFFGWLIAVASWYLAPVGRFETMAEFGLGTTLFILWFLLAVLPPMALVMLSGSIGGELYRRSLAVLMTTPVTGRQIVLGKLGGRLVEILLLLAISLPALSAIRGFGGVDEAYVAAGLLIILGACVFGASVSLFLSIFSRSALGTIGRAALALGLLYIGLPIMAYVLLSHQATAPAAGLVSDLALHVNPYWALAIVTEEALDPRATAQGLSLPLYCLATFGMSAVLVGISIPLVRHIAIVQVTGDTRLARRRARRAAAAGLDEEAAAKLRPVVGPPVMWKELRAAVAGIRLRQLVGSGVALVALAALYAVAAGYLAEPGTQSVFIGGYLLIAMTATGVAAASRITAEKEAGTWQALVGTSLSDRDLIYGKAVGAVARCLPYWIVPGLHLLVCTILGFVHPVALLQLGMLAAGLIWFITALGLACSAYCRKTTSAVIATFAFGALLWGVVPISNGVGMIGALYLHPVAQAVQVMAATTGPEVPWTLLGPKYDLCSFAEPVPTVLTATFFIYIATAVHVILGQLLLRSAMKRARRNG